MGGSAAAVVGRETRHGIRAPHGPTSATHRSGTSPLCEGARKVRSLSTGGARAASVTVVTGGYALRLDEAERIRYRQMAAAARGDEAERWSRAGVVPGARVADVGCGPGAVLVELARLVGPEGRAVGIEPDPAARAAAREEIDTAEVAWADVRAGTGQATGLEPDVWDCVMVRHMLIHIGEAAAAIVEHLAGLATPGGFVYLVDTDLDGARTSPADPELDAQHRRYAEYHRAMGNDVRMGPRLPVLLAEAGLEVVEVAGAYACIPAAVLGLGGPLRAAQDAMVAAGALDAAEAQRSAEARQRFAQHPGALLWMPQFVAVGRRPA